MSIDALLSLLALTILYFLAGLLGLQLQSAQTGITPFWPASGIALAVFILYSKHLWPAIFLAMGGIALTMGIPLPTAMLAAAGSVLEALIPLLIAQRFGFNGSLRSLHQLLMFIGISWTGPLLSAGIGISSFYLFVGDLPAAPLNLFLVWWLGNSFGILLFASTLLLLNDFVRYDSWENLKNPWLISIGLASVLISLGAFQDVTSIQSPLLLTLLIPLVILSSVFLNFLGTIVPVLIATLIMMIQSVNYPVEALNQDPLGFLYLDIVVLWVITLTGLVVSVAQREGVRHMRHSWLANHDGLTSLKNRHFVENRLINLCQGLRQQDNRFSLLFLDLDKFKRVNDKVGHIVGDNCLAHIANLLRHSARMSDTVARWGGDEFVILLPDCPLPTAQQIASDINRNLEENPFVHGDHVFQLSFSIGVATAKSGTTAQQVINQADKASYQAKESGKAVVLAEDLEATK
ncbi:MAG: diguanylate cyclase [Gammaproteobacteria bacterium]|nr:diguanylate cyclase [Gammaproteobacteria bacterium]